MFLQESDVFMDAMLAANTMKEPRKRKRRISTSKDSGHSDAKKEAVGGSPSHSPKGEDTSPSSIKPTFKVIIKIQNLIYNSYHFVLTFFSKIFCYFN